AERAGEVLGMELSRGKRHYNWFNTFMNDSAAGRRVVAERGVDSLGKCDHVLRVKGAPESDYEIGLVAEKDGSFSLLYDTWGSGRKLEEKCGTGLARFRQEYAVAVAQRRVERTLSREGFRMTREDVGCGVRLRVRRR